MTKTVGLGVSLLLLASCTDKVGEEVNGIPTYAIYNSKGARTYKVIGLAQVEDIKTEI